MKVERKGRKDEERNLTRATGARWKNEDANEELLEAEELAKLFE